MSSAPRFFFIHVMKTGGTSFVFHLLRQFPADDIYPSAAIDRRHPTDVEPYASYTDLAALPPERRATARVYAGHFPFVARDLIGPDVSTFTLLRDPVDRSVSVLKHFRRLFDRYGSMPLEEIYDDELVYRHFVENYQTKVFSLTAEDRPQSFVSSLSYSEIYARLAVPRARDSHEVRTAEETITIDAARLARAKTNLDLVDVVGLNDDYRGFVDELRRRFGWWSSGLDDEARANVSAEPWAASASLRERIALDNRFDIELYEHAQELVRDRRD